MDYRYLGSSFRGPLTRATIGYHPIDTGYLVVAGHVLELVDERVWVPVENGYHFGR